MFALNMKLETNKEILIWINIANDKKEKKTVLKMFHSRRLRMFYVWMEQDERVINVPFTLTTK